MFVSIHDNLANAMVKEWLMRWYGPFYHIRPSLYAKLTPRNFRAFAYAKLLDNNGTYVYVLWYCYLGLLYVILTGFFIKFFFNEV